MRKLEKLIHLQLKWNFSIFSHFSTINHWSKQCLITKHTVLIRVDHSWLTCEGWWHQILTSTNFQCLVGVLTGDLFLIPLVEITTHLSWVFRKIVRKLAVRLLRNWQSKIRVLVFIQSWKLLEHELGSLTLSDKTLQLLHSHVWPLKITQRC